MPIDKQTLKEVLREAAGDDGELYAILEQKLLANDAQATQFISGFMRNRDYTQKSQALAEDRRKLETQHGGEVENYKAQLEQYRQALEGAETSKQQVLRDLATHKESLQGAYARLKHIKDIYQLTDADIPDYKDLIDTAQKGKPVDSSNDLDERFAKFEKGIKDYLAQKLVPELGGIAQLDIVWAEIRDEHKELTGKSLTAKESNELLLEANKRNREGKPASIKQIWEEKYDTAGLRMKKHDEDLLKTNREKWEAEQIAKRSEEAMAGLRPTAPDQQGYRTSNILNHKFKIHEELPAGAPKPREAPSANDRSSLTGAERATRKFLERRANGIPMGAPDEHGAKPTKVA